MLSSTSTAASDVGGVILGKNRHGPGGEMPVYIDYRTLRVSEALPDEEDKWPAANKK